MKEWKKLIEAEHIEVSNYGDVKNTKTGKYLGKSTKPRYRKFSVEIDDKIKCNLIHRSVAILFVSGYEEGLVVHHIDGDKHNNHYSNLEWVTQSYNVQQVKNRKQNPRLSDAQKKEIKKDYNSGKSTHWICNNYNKQYNVTIAYSTYRNHLK